MTLNMMSRQFAFALICLIASVVFSCLGAIREAGWLQTVELVHYDFATQTLAHPELAPDVVLVAIDDQDLSAWGWPLPDQHLADLIRIAASAGARVVGVDIYRDNPVEPGAEALRLALDDPRVIAISKLGPKGRTVIAPPEPVRAAGRYGFSDTPIDFDGVSRRALLLINDQEGLKLSFGLKVAMTALGQTDLQAAPDDPRVLMFGPTRIPGIFGDFGSYRNSADQGYQIMTRFPRRLPMSPVIAARTVLAGQATDQLAGKVVLIALTSDSIKDYFITPLNRNTGANFAFGAQVHGALIQQLLDHSSGTLAPVRSPGRAWQLALIFAASALGAGAALIARSALAALLLGPVAALGIGGALTWGLGAGLWLPVMPIMLAWLLGFLLLYMVISVMARRQRRAMAGLFSSHLSPELAREIWRNRDTILAGGKPIPRRLTSTVLFADIASSTRIGRSLEPDVFMDWISTILDNMAQVARDHGGFVEKFTGDGIVVVFGAPLASETRAEQQRDAQSACACALAQRALIEDLNRTPGLAAPYRVRIGLHSGTLLGGTLGRAGSLQYNVIGDTVNVAARVEAWSKSLTGENKSGTVICLTDATAGLLEDQYILKAAGVLTHDNGKDQFDIHTLLNAAQQNQS
jgi:adenylate cyclase